jgi:hypothetical protein
LETEIGLDVEAHDDNVEQRQRATTTKDEKA